MKSKAFLILFFVLAFIAQSYAQHYTYNKTVFSGNGVSNKVLKVKGEVFISDTSITIITDATDTSPKQKVDYNIFVDKKSDNFLKAKARLKYRKYAIAFTLYENQTDNKKEKFILNVETTENYTQEMSNTAYYLIPTL